MPMHAHGSGVASFVAAWTVMMVPMMLPSLGPALSRSARPIVLALAYYAVWTALGLAVHAAGRVLGAAAPAPPVARGVVVLLAGALQFTAWKGRHLARSRAVAADAGGASRSAVAAWWHGLRLGVYCVRSCAGPMLALLALGAMDLRVMTVVTLAITAERLAPQGLLAARVAGATAMGAGLVQIALAYR